jgi:hypothetical protein
MQAKFTPQAWIRRACRSQGLRQAAVTGLAVAVALVAAIAWTRDEGPSTGQVTNTARTTDRPAKPVSAAKPRQGQVVYYIVHSEEQERLVYAWSWYEVALFGSDPGYRRSTFVPLWGGDTLQVADLKRSLEAMTWSTGESFQLIELLPHGAPPVP